MKTIILVFAYEELNVNILLNSVLHNAKAKQNFKFVAYVPAGFKSLFFSADEVIEIPKEINSFSNYSEVAEYGVARNGNNIQIRDRIQFKINKTVLHFLSKTKLIDKTLISILSLARTKRQSEFLYKSKVLRWVKTDAKKRFQTNYVVVPAQNCIKIEDACIKFQSPSLTENFTYLFSQHETAIENGLRIRDKKGIDSSKKVYLRTRNYENKQTIHNTQLTEILEISKELINCGFTVVNIGSPALSIQDHLSAIERDQYVEFNNVLTLDQEIEMLNGPVICQADAGLFVMAALLPVPLICLTREWSEFLNVSLINARKSSGWKSDLAYEEKSSSKERIEKIINLISL